MSSAGITRFRIWYIVSVASMVAVSVSCHAISDKKNDVAVISPNPVNPLKEGISIQTGYEGYLVPTLEESLKLDESTIGKLSSLLIWAKKNLLPKILSAVLKSSEHLISAGSLAASALVAGSVITTFICVFTPFCSLQIAPLDNHFSDDMVRSFLKPEKMSALHSFVKSAIEKHSDSYKKLDM